MAEVGKTRFLDDAVAGGHDDRIVRIVEHGFVQSQHGFDLFARFDLDQVDDRLALAGAGAFRNVVNVHPIHVAAVGEVEDQVVAVRIEEVFHMVLVLGFHADDADATAVLRAVGIGRNALDVAGIGDRDHAGMARDQVGVIQVAFVVGDLGAALVGVFGLDFQQFGLDDAEPEFAAGQQALEVIDQLHQFIVFVLEVLNGQAGQLIQPHVEDGVGLDLGESETCDQGGLRFFAVAGRADDLDHFVDVADRDQQTFQDVGAGFRFRQLEPGPAGHHFQTVVDERLQDLAQVQRARPVVVDHQHLAAENAFHLRMGVKLVQHHGAHRAALDLNDDPDAGPQAGFVAQVGNAGDLFILDQFTDLLDQHFLVDRIRNFVDDDEFLAVFLDHFGFGADLDHAVTGFIKTADRIQTADDRTGREVRAGQELHQFTDRGGGIFQQMHRGVHHFAEVVRRNVRGHADADTHAAVHQQVRELGRQHFRFIRVFVEGRDHVHRILVDVRQQFFGETLHAALGVTVSSRRVAVDASEVALTVHQRHAHGKILRHAHQGVVDRSIAVRVIFTDHFADHTCALHVRTGFDQPQLTHRKQNAPVAGLEPVTHIRDRPSYVHAQRILQIRSMHDVFDIDGNIPFLDRTASFFTHGIIPSGKSFRFLLTMQYTPVFMQIKPARVRACEKIRFFLRFSRKKQKIHDLPAGTGHGFP